MSSFDWVMQTAPLMVFDIDEAHGEATGRVTVNERYQRSSGKKGSLLGVYHDRYRRVGSDWLFAERRLQIVEAA